MSEDFDLFGLPIRVGHGKRGRPTFEVTQEKANKIKLGLALGWSNERLARAIACSPATLKRHFRAELAERDMARDQLELERFSMLMATAKRGVVGAVVEMGRFMEKNDATLADERIAAAQSRAKGAASEAAAKAAERVAKPLGKKEAAQKAAHDASGGGSAWLGDLTPGFDMPN